MNETTERHLRLPDQISALLDLPPHLDGSQGVFRMQNPTMPATYATDREGIIRWLNMFDRRTRDSYEKEAYRFWAWAVFEKQKPLSSISHEDVMEYRDFLAFPSPNWIDGKGVRQSNSWRPFKKKGLAPSSIKTSCMTLRSLFRLLVHDEYVLINPFVEPTKRNRDSKNADRTVTRFLDERQVQYLFDYVESYPRETSRERAIYERDRWILHFYYYTGCRRSEGVNAKMGDFYRQIGGEMSCWFIKVTGKGDKVRSVSVPDELVAALIQYRQYKGLPPLPSKDDDTPLLMHLHSREDAGGETIYQSVKRICHQASKRLALSDPISAASMMAATTHWMRHSRGSHALANGATIIDIMEEFGHSDIRSTTPYLHGGKLARHERMNNSSSVNPGTDASIRSQEECK